MLCDRCQQREVTIMHFGRDPARPELPLEQRLCAVCASEVYGTALPSHRFAQYFLRDGDPVLRVMFAAGDVYRLRSFSTVDPSVGGIPDQWVATVVEPIAGTHPDFRRLFRPGSGIQFVESDITQITDDSSGRMLFCHAVT